MSEEVAQAEHIATLYEQRQRLLDELHAAERELGAAKALITGMRRASRSAQTELTALRELYDDVERWRAGGGDVRDVGYILETADRIRASVAIDAERESRAR